MGLIEGRAVQDRYFPENSCFGCGPANPDGFRLKSDVVGDELVASWTAPAYLRGPPGVVNGGALAIPLDCHGTWTAMRALSDARGELTAAVTVAYRVELRAATPVERPVALRARAVSVTDRKAVVEVTAAVDGAVTATLEGTWVAVPMFEHA